MLSFYDLTCLTVQRMVILSPAGIQRPAALTCQWIRHLVSDHRVLLQSLHLPSVPSTENLCAAMPAENDDSVSSRDRTPGSIDMAMDQAPGERSRLLLLCSRAYICQRRLMYLRRQVAAECPF